MREPCMQEQAGNGGRSNFSARRCRRAAGLALPALPCQLARAAQQLAAAVPHFVDIFGGHMQVGVVEHHVVAGVFGVLHGAEHGVGAAVQHDVEGAEVDVALIAQRQER